MQIALKEAQAALAKGNYPVGAVLIIGGEIVAKEQNTLHKGQDWVSHAELTLIKNNSNRIKEAIKKKGLKVELVSTLEPCLMCLGAILLNRISRVVFACPDPLGGATTLNVESLPAWYGRKWPQIEGGLFKEESYRLLVTFMKNKENWCKILPLFEEMHTKW